jgi:hypothetical protein
MAKNHRIEVRLNEEDYQRLRQRAEVLGTTLTGAVESLLRVSSSVALFNVRSVGVRGRRRVSVRFSSGMAVHGFLWSRGGQLLAPRVHTPKGYVPIVRGSKAFWKQLRALFERELPEHIYVAPDGEVEVADARFAAM